jgi:hypothetical protein
MKQRFIKILSFAVLLSSNFNAQTFNNLFRTKDRPDNWKILICRNLAGDFSWLVIILITKWFLILLMGWMAIRVCRIQIHLQFWSRINWKMRLNEFLISG